MAIKAIAHRLGIYGNTVRGALSTVGPPKHQCVAKDEIALEVEPQVCELCAQFSEMPATVIAELVVGAGRSRCSGSGSCICSLCSVLRFRRH